MRASLASFSIKVHQREKGSERRARARARPRARSAPRTRSVRSTPVTCASMTRRWPRATGYPLPNREGRGREARAGSGAMKIPNPGWMDSLSLTEIGHFPSMRRMSGYRRAARDNLDGFDVDLTRRAVDAARALSLEKSRRSPIDLTLLRRIFFVHAELAEALWIANRFQDVGRH